MKKLIIFVCLLITSIAIYSFTLGKGDECPAEGKANPKKGKHAELKGREKSLNRHKNRASIPQESDYDYSATIEKMYDSKDDSLWDENKAGVLTGYVFKAMDEGMESCNCYTEDKTRYSIKVYLSPVPLNKQTRTADCIVVVITPYSRTLHPEWTSDFINDKLIAKKVKVSGWLIYDYLHSTGSIETNSNGAQPERRTIWGLCPVTDIKAAD